MSDMVTINELLENKQFKQFFLTAPKLPSHYTPETKPWRLLMLLTPQGKWQSRRFGTYNEAFKVFKAQRGEGLHNAAINCPGLAFRPPIRNVRTKRLDAKGKPVIATMVYKYRESADVTPHDWCGYCRRPTIFLVSRRGPKRAGNMILPPTEVKNRCTLCGSSEEIMNLRFPEMNQRWDLVNRVKLTTNVVRSDK